MRPAHVLFINSSHNVFVLPVDMIQFTLQTQININLRVFFEHRPSFMLLKIRLTWGLCLSVKGITEGIGGARERRGCAPLNNVPFDFNP